MKVEGALEKIITYFAFLSEAIRTNFKNALSQLQRGKAFSISQNSFVYFLGKQVRDYYQFSAYTKSSEKLVFYSTCANQRLKNVNFSENFVYAPNKRSLLYMSLILHKKFFSEEVVLSSKYDKLIVIFALLKQNQGFGWRSEIARKLYSLLADDEWCNAWWITRKNSWYEITIRL